MSEFTKGLEGDDIRREARAEKVAQRMIQIANARQEAKSRLELLKEVNDPLTPVIGGNALPRFGEEIPVRQENGINIPIVKEPFTQRLKNLFRK